MLYIIKRVSDGMWLMGHMDGGCGAPTCIWGEHQQDAMPFDTPTDAQKTAKKIGGCMVFAVGGDGIEHCTADTGH